MKYFDRVKETATTTGTGDFTLAGATTGFRTFASVLSTNDTCYYCIALQGGSEWEVGLGTYSASNTLTRTTVLSSSNSNNAVNFSAGTKDVFLTVAARRFDLIDLTGASSDYLLQPGEKAKVTFSSATSVPLRVESEAGIYIINLIGTQGVTISNDNNATLSANNTTYSNAIKRQSAVTTSTTTAAGVATESSFALGSGNILLSRTTISTHLTCKTVLVDANIKLTSGQYTIQSHATWEDNTTAWTSLGTLTLPFAQTGIVYIERQA